MNYLCVTRHFVELFQKLLNLNSNLRTGDVLSVRVFFNYTHIWSPLYCCFLSYLRDETSQPNIYHWLIW